MRSRAARPPLLTREEYLHRVRRALPAHHAVRASEIVEGLRRRIGTLEDEEHLRRDIEAFLMDPEAGHVGVLEIYDIEHVRAALSRPGHQVHNWHYDRSTRALLVNLRRGSHERLSAALYDAYIGAVKGEDGETSAERFIAEGLGWFRSSVGRAALRARLVILDAQERMAFQDVEFRVEDMPVSDRRPNAASSSRSNHS